MSKLLNNNLENVFETVVKKSCAPWADSYVAELKKKIEEFQTLMVNETKYDCNCDLTDENFLYGCFKRNIQHGEFIGNWQVLKYFMIHMKIKAIKYMCGEWTFTENDKEMYDYFNNIVVDAQTKCKPKFIKIQNGVEPNLHNFFMIDHRNDYCVEYLTTYKGYGSQNTYTRKTTSFVWMMYSNWFLGIENLARHAKLLPKFEYCKDFFNYEFKPYEFDDENCVSYKLVKANEKIITPEEQESIDNENFTKFNIKLDTALKSNAQYMEILNRYNEIRKKITLEYINENRPEFDALSSKYKAIYC